MAAEEPSTGGTPREPARRLFFALWPDDPMREAMTRATRLAVQGSGGRPVPPQNLHVTLAFLGSVPERRLPQLAEIARSTTQRWRSALPRPRVPSPELLFDRLEHWPRAHLLCAVSAAPPAWVEALTRQLQAWLLAGGFAPDVWGASSGGLGWAGAYRPHVTLVRGLQGPPRLMQMPPVTWGFTDFVLADSNTLPQGPLYRVLARFLLGVERDIA